MRTPQLRQRPRNSSHETTGTLSYGLTGAPQPGQCDPGLTSDSPAGTRWATTLRKLPMTSPIRPPARISGADAIVAARYPGRRLALVAPT